VGGGVGDKEAQRHRGTRNKSQSQQLVPAFQVHGQGVCSSVLTLQFSFLGKENSHDLNHCRVRSYHQRHMAQSGARESMLQK
jgi:hypothetical protein